MRTGSDESGVTGIKKRRLLLPSAVTAPFVPSVTTTAAATLESADEMSSLNLRVTVKGVLPS